jgi:hypothetical protein
MQVSKRLMPRAQALLRSCRKPEIRSFKSLENRPKKIFENSDLISSARAEESYIDAVSARKQQLFFWGGMDQGADGGPGRSPTCDLRVGSSLKQLRRPSELRNEFRRRLQ